MNRQESSTFFHNYLKKLIDDNSLENEVIEIVSFFKVVQLKKNDFFVKENEVCRHFCFIASGILQHSILVLDEEKTTYLALKNSVTTSLKSFLYGLPSRKSVKAISDCTLWVVNLEIFQDLMKNNPAFNRFYCNLIEKQICLIDDYRIDLLTLTPEERYQKLLLNEPKLLQEVPLHYLSSFMGISSRHMSRIRKNVK